MSTTQTSPLRVALIGAGSFAEERLLPLFREQGLELRSVLSRDASRAKQLADKFGATASNPCPSSLEQLFADDTLQAVVIANHDARHAEAAIAAAKAGKHVFVEKPLATSLFDAREVAQACRVNNVRCMVGFHNRFAPANTIVREALEKGSIGQVRRLHLRWSSQQTMNWRGSCDLGPWWVLAALGAHVMDLSEWLLAPSCGPIVDLRALASDGVHHQGADESAVISLRFKNGALVTLEISCVDEAVKHIEITGTAGKIICRNTLGAGGGGVVLLNSESVPFEPCNPYAAELAAFVSAIRSGKDLEPNAADGVRNVEWLERIEASFNGV